MPKKQKQSTEIRYFTLQEILDHLDGNGLVITDCDLIEDALKEIAVSPTAKVERLE